MHEARMTQLHTHPHTQNAAGHETSREKTQKTEMTLIRVVKKEVRLGWVAKYLADAQNCVQDKSA